jgi:hypothetical protein
MRAWVTLLLAAAAAASTVACRRDDGKIVALTVCPEGATLEGEAPPAGLRQRCQKGEATRHGASREWYEDGRERAYSEWWEGEKHGRFALWFKTGKLRAEGAHRFGQPAGRWRYYGEDGALRQDRTFDVAAPAADWVAQAIAGKPPVRDVPRASGQASSEMTGAGAIESPLADGLPPVKEPGAAAPAKAGLPTATPGGTDPVFPRGAKPN